MKHITTHKRLINYTKQMIALYNIEGSLTLESKRRHISSAIGYYLGVCDVRNWSYDVTLIAEWSEMSGTLAF